LPSDVTYYQALARSTFSQRSWIIAMGSLVQCNRFADRLDDLGASKVICIAPRRGAGELSAPSHRPQIDLNLPPQPMLAFIRATLQAFGALPQSAADELNRYDPERQARVIGDLFSTDEPLCGRPTYGGRPAPWRKLENKMTVDALWDRCGVPRAPYSIVPARLDALVDAAKPLDWGAGTMWAGDNREGWHGGATYLRWVRSPGDAALAAEFFEVHCDRVRIMPFLEGIPCSIHGIVFADAVIALRPCEMLVFRTPNDTRLTYAKAATFWDPHPDDRQAMRDIAKRVGSHLQQTLGFRGAFTVDGIMSRDGFLPTELNPRYGAALGTLASGVSELPLYLLNAMIVEGESLDFRPQDLEDLLVDAADAHRRGSTFIGVDAPIDEERSSILVTTANGLRFAQAAGFLNEQWNLGLKPLEAAREARRR